MTQTLELFDRILKQPSENKLLTHLKQINRESENKIEHIRKTKMETLVSNIRGVCV